MLSTNYSVKIRCGADQEDSEKGVLLMLDKVMMERKEVRKDYDERLVHLEIRMGELQRQCRSMGIPIVIVFEGFLRPEKEQ